LYLLRSLRGKGSGISLAPAVSYVEANYTEKLRLATAAKLCNLTTFQFSRYFKKQNGLNFRAFVVQLRIQRAALLLNESQMSVTEAAFIVGFNDCSHFFAR
jgi:two-component system response regulator YesN